MRLKTSSEEFAWIVDREPSLPWLIALSIVTISSPRTSPTITRDGFWRSDRRTSSAIDTPPRPSELGSRSSNATTLGCASSNLSSPSSRARSTVISRSCGGISAASARSSVVFPEFVEPGDHDVLAGPHRRLEERRDLRGHGAVADQVVEADLAQARAADRDARPRAHRHHRGEPRAVRAAGGRAGGWRSRTGGRPGRRWPRGSGSARSAPRRSRRPARASSSRPSAYCTKTRS